MYFSLSDSDVLLASNNYDIFNKILNNLLFIKYGYFNMYNRSECDDNVVYIKNEFESFLNFLCEKKHIEFEYINRYKSEKFKHITIVDMLVDNDFKMGYEGFKNLSQLKCITSYFRNEDISTIFVDYIIKYMDLSLVKKYINSNVEIKANWLGDILYNDWTLSMSYVVNLNTLIGSEYLNRQAKINMLLE